MAGILDRIFGRVYQYEMKHDEAAERNVKWTVKQEKRVMPQTTEKTPETDRTYTQVSAKKEQTEVEKEDFLLKQIDEFREKAKQLQGLLASKESKVAELQSIVDENEIRAKHLENMVNERKEAAEVLLTGVHTQMDDMIAQVETKLNVLAEKIEKNVNDTTGRTAEQTAEMKTALDDVSKQLDAMKLELAEKIHNEDVKCYRNMASLIEELTAKLEANDSLDQKLHSVKNYVKFMAWFLVVDFVVLVAFILYSLGIFG